MEQIRVEFLKQGVRISFRKVSLAPAFHFRAGAFQGRCFPKRKGAKMKIHLGGRPPASREASPGFPDQGQVRTGDHQDGLLQQPGVRRVLHRLVPVPDVGGLIQQQVARVSVRLACQPLLQQAQQAMLIIDQLPGEKRDIAGRHSVRQQLRHPLFQQGGFAHLPTAAQGVNAGGFLGQARQQCRDMDMGLLGQLAQLGVALGKLGRVVPMGVMGKKSRVQFDQWPLNKFIQW